MLVHKSLNVIKYFADEKKIKLKIVIEQKSEFIEVDISDSESLVKINQKNIFTNLFGDERRYLQILLNFVSNALKFSNEGGTITIRLKLVEQ
jgi:signal transduction histidine kinase